MHLIVIPLRILINDSNARTSSKIVELVEENFFPGLRQLCSRVGFPVEPCERGVLLRIQHPFFALTHISLLPGLCCVGSAMMLKIQLVIPCGNTHLALRRNG